MNTKSNKGGRVPSVNCSSKQPVLLRNADGQLVQSEQTPTGDTVQNNVAYAIMTPTRDAMDYAIESNELSRYLHIARVDGRPYGLTAALAASSFGANVIRGLAAPQSASSVSDANNHDASGAATANISIQSSVFGQNGGTTSPEFPSAKEEVDQAIAAAWRLQYLEEARMNAAVARRAAEAHFTSVDKAFYRQILHMAAVDAEHHNSQQQKRRESEHRVREQEIQNQGGQLRQQRPGDFHQAQFQHSQSGSMSNQPIHEANNISEDKVVSPQQHMMEIPLLSDRSRPPLAVEFSPPLSQSNSAYQHLWQVQDLAKRHLQQERPPCLPLLQQWHDPLLRCDRAPHAYTNERISHELNVEVPKAFSCDPGGKGDETIVYKKKINVSNDPPKNAVIRSNNEADGKVTIHSVQCQNHVNAMSTGRSAGGNGSGSARIIVNGQGSLVDPKGDKDSSAEIIDVDDVASTTNKLGVTSSSRSEGKSMERGSSLNAEHTFEKIEGASAVKVATTGLELNGKSPMALRKKSGEFAQSCLGTRSRDKESINTASVSKRLKTIIVEASHEVLAAREKMASETQSNSLLRESGTPERATFLQSSEKNKIENEKVSNLGDVQHRSIEKEISILDSQSQKKEKREQRLLAEKKEYVLPKLRLPHEEQMSQRQAQSKQHTLQPPHDQRGQQWSFPHMYQERTSTDPMNAILKRLQAMKNRDTKTSVDVHNPYAPTDIDGKATSLNFSSATSTSSPGTTKSNINTAAAKPSMSLCDPTNINERINVRHVPTIEGDVIRAMPSNASSIFHVMNRRVNLDEHSKDSSIYSLLRSWVQDDPYRISTLNKISLLDCVVLPSSKRFLDCVIEDGPCVQLEVKRMQCTDVLFLISKEEEDDSTSNSGREHMERKCHIVDNDVKFLLGGHIRRSKQVRAKVCKSRKKCYERAIQMLEASNLLKSGA